MQESAHGSGEGEEFQLTDKDSTHSLDDDSGSDSDYTESDGYQSDDEQAAKYSSQARPRAKSRVGDNYSRSAKRGFVRKNQTMRNKTITVAEEKGSGLYHVPDSSAHASISSTSAWSESYPLWDDFSQYEQHYPLQSYHQEDQRMNSAVYSQRDGYDKYPGSWVRQHNDHPHGGYGAYYSNTRFPQGGMDPYSNNIQPSNPSSRDYAGNMPTPYERYRSRNNAAYNRVQDQQGRMSEVLTYAGNERRYDAGTTRSFNDLYERGHSEADNEPNLDPLYIVPNAPTLEPLITQRSSASLSSLRQQEVLEQFPSLNGAINVGMDGPGQQAPSEINQQTHVSTALWEEEGTLCLVVELRGMAVTRRCDNNMINGTKLLNSAQITRGRRDGVLKGERVRHVVKIGGMDFKGVWIPFERALDMAQRENVLDSLYPLFVADLTPILYSAQNYSRLRQLLAKGSRRNPKFNNWINGIPRPNAEPVIRYQPKGQVSARSGGVQNQYSSYATSPSQSLYNISEDAQGKGGGRPQARSYNYRPQVYEATAHQLGSEAYRNHRFTHGSGRETHRHRRGMSQDTMPYELPSHFNRQSFYYSAEALQDRNKVQQSSPTPQNDGQELSE